VTDQDVHSDGCAPRPQRGLWRFARPQGSGRSRKEWVQAALDARAEPRLPRTIEDPDTLDFIAGIFLAPGRVRPTIPAHRSEPG
jgi:hypothetical protein